MRRKGRVEVAQNPGFLVFYPQHPRMTVRQQHDPLPGRAQAQQEILSARQPGNALRVGPFECLDIELELATPVIDAVPGKRALTGAKARGELGSSDVYSRRTRRRISSGDDLEPEMIVIRQIQQRAVQIQQYGIYMAPIGLFNGSRRHGGAARNTGAYDTSRGAVGAGPLS